MKTNRASTIAALALLAAATLTAGCGGSGDGSSEDNGQSTQSLRISGAVQKGPFVVGTPVWVNKLAADGTPGEVTVVTEIEDSVGSFSFDISSPGPVQIVSNGYYFSELTGQISEGQLTLKAIYDVTGQGSQGAYVNLMTHLTNDRVLELVKSGQSVALATEQAQTELLTALDPVLPSRAMPRFTDLSIYDVDAANKEANAYLLALSTAFYKYGEIEWQRIEADGGRSSADAQLSLILNVVAKDFADDGQIQLEGFTNKLTRALRSVSPEMVAKHLRDRSQIDHLTPIDVPDITQYFDVCVGDAVCAWEARAPMPAAWRNARAVAVGDRIFVVGGVYEESGGRFDYNTKTYSYSPASNTWSLHRESPVASDLGLESFAWKGALYVVGPDRYSLAPVLARYDAAKDEWIQVHHFGSAVPWPARMEAFVAGKIYFSHGLSFDVDSEQYASTTPLSSGTTCATEERIVKVIYEENALSVRALAADGGTWSTVNMSPPLPPYTGQGACASFDQDAYILGGYGVGSRASYLDSILRYDGRTNTFGTFETRLPASLAGAAAAAVGKKIYLFGGATENEGGDSVVLDSVYVLDLEALE